LLFKAGDFGDQTVPLLDLLFDYAEFCPPTSFSSFGALDRQIAGSRPLENPIHVICSASPTRPNRIHIGAAKSDRRLSGFCIL
jgi:hypothetical protein